MATKKDEANAPSPPEEQTLATSDAEPKEPETFEIPEDLRGKTDEELAKMVLDTRKKLGEKGQETGEKLKSLEEELKAEKEYRRQREDEARLAELYQQQPSYTGIDPYGQPIPQEPAKPRKQFNYEDPYGSMEEYLAEREKRQQQQAHVAARYNATEEGKLSFQEGRQKAFRLDPDLYKGIEREVEQRIFNAYAPLAQGGMSVKQYVGNPDVWRQTAANVRLQSGEFELVPKKTRPMKATPTETPTPARPMSDDVPGMYDLDTNDPKMQAWLQVMSKYKVGQTPDKRKEILRKQQEREREVF